VRLISRLFHAIDHVLELSFRRPLPHVDYHDNFRSPINGTYKAG
jgi:hypothetical protein